MKNKILDFNTLSSLEQEQYPIGEVELEVGKEKFLVKYEQKFRESKIQDLVKEWMLIQEEVNNKVDVNMYDISFILILKHFTDIPFDQIDNVLDRIEHYIRMTNLLLNLKDNKDVSLFEKVFSVIDKEQILKVTTTMNKMAKNIIEQTKQLEESEEYKKVQEYMKESENIGD